MAVSADQPVSVGNLSAVLGSIAGGGPLGGNLLALRAR